MTKKENSWMGTYTGIKFYPYDPKAEQIDIYDIATSLSHLCRFTGHCNRFYSVAQHSLNAAYILDELGYDTKLQLYALLHDASEAYISDLNRPFKIHLSQYVEVEDEIQDIIWEHFGLDKPTEEEYKIIKMVDNEILYWEAKELTKNIDDWADQFKSIPGYEFNTNLLNEVNFTHVELVFGYKTNQLLDKLNIK